jgi:hypothetical protein
LSAMSRCGFMELDPLGYMADAINTDGEITDLTLELLEDAVRLTHPDCHPAERQELAKHVTQQFLALKPFVFSKPEKPKAEIPATTARNESAKYHRENLKEPLQKILSMQRMRRHDPVLLLRNLRPEWEKRCREQRERENKKQREQYAKRKARLAWKLPLKHCEACGEKVTTE